jgi:outer membrane protein TolC
MGFRITTAAIALFALSGCAVSPEPTTPEERAGRVEADQAAMFENQPPVSAPIGLYEAEARAIKFNLAQRSMLMERAVAEGIADNANYDLLPQLTYSAGYSARTKSDASYGTLATDDKDISTYSTSFHEKQHRTAELSMSWNILDFGVSYLRAHQSADRALIAEERRRKAMQVLIQDVRSAWWRAYSSDRLLADLDPLLARLRGELDASRASEKQAVTPVATLDYQRELLETIRVLQSLRDEISHAKIELATLINLPPDHPITLAPPPAESALATPELAETLGALEHKALLDRPELREEDYKARISTDETRKSMLRLLPGIELDADLNYDSDNHLWNTMWADAGTKLTWNLMNLVSGRSTIALNHTKEDLGKLRRLALNMTVLAQVNVAWTRVHLAEEQYKAAADLNAVDERIVAQIRTGTPPGPGKQRDLLHREANRVISQTLRDAGFTELQNAAAALRLSTGADPLPDDLDTDDLTALTEALRHQAKPPEAKPAEAPQEAKAEAPTEVKPAAPEAEARPDETTIVMPPEPAPAVAKAEEVAAPKPPEAEPKSVGAPLALTAPAAAAAPVAPPVDADKPAVEVFEPPAEAAAAPIVLIPPPGMALAHMQIGAFPTEAEAWKHWKTLSHHHTALAKFEPAVREAVVPPKGTFYRLVVLGKVEALTPVCAGLKAKSVDCFVQRSP